jgi:hypothetical protein
LVGAVVVTDRTPVGRDHAAEVRKHLGDGRVAIADRGSDHRAAEPRTAASALVLLDELAHVIDRPDAVHVALALRLSPREQAVTAEDDAVAAGSRLDGLSQHQRQLESGTLPGHPRDPTPVVPIERFELFRAVRARGERDRPVGMQMVDVRERQERVERRVDRRGDAIFTERAQRVERDHLVLVRFAAIARDQRLELVQIQHRKPGGRDGPQIAAAALHRHDAARLAGERIRQLEFRAGVAAAEVRDAQVFAEQVRSIAQQLEGVGRERRRCLVVPEILQPTCHRISHFPPRIPHVPRPVFRG